VAEGPQAVREAVLAHASRSSGTGVVDSLYATDQAAARYGGELEMARAAGIEVLLADDAVLAAMTDTVTPQGLLAVCRLVDRPLGAVLDELRRERDDAPRRRPLLVAVLAQVRDPGNAGTVLRAADAAGADAVVLTSGSVDVHNPKCVRSTAGSLFHLPVVQDVALDDVAGLLRGAGLALLAADGAGGHDLDDLQDDAERDADALLRRSTAWLFGNEAWGLPDHERGLADAVVRVPLHGRAESLNLATAATVCLYASARAHRRPPAGTAPGDDAEQHGGTRSRYSPIMGTRLGDGGGGSGDTGCGAGTGGSGGTGDVGRGDGTGAR
jgi:TrmH family RNA methyltransferase